jgi:hypothetical protein
VPDVLPVVEPVEEPVVEPGLLALLLEPYGEDDELAPDDGPIETSVRMNLSLLELELPVLDVLLSVVLPDVPVLPIVAEWSAVVRHPVSVTGWLLRSDLFQSLEL